MQITIDQMMDAADRELRRLQLSAGIVYGHCKELREFTDYCTQNAIQIYKPDTGITVKDRKAAHSMRHTVASMLLRDGVPLMTISNILGHDTPKTTIAYTKIDLTALRKCALSYGARREMS